MKNEKSMTEIASIHSVSQVDDPRESCSSNAPTTPSGEYILSGHFTEDNLFVAPSVDSNQSPITQKNYSAKPTLTKQSPVSRESTMSDPDFHDRSLHPPSGDFIFRNIA